MMERVVGPVSGVRPHRGTAIGTGCWGRTSGGGSPTLDTPSPGVASITDAGVGQLDVSFERGQGAATYCAGVVTMATSGTLKDIGHVSLTTVPTATVIRFINNTAIAGATADPALGYQFMVLGLV